MQMTETLVSAYFTKMSLSSLASLFPNQDSIVVHCVNTLRFSLPTNLLTPDT